jgi:hypothetical protein
MNLVNTEGFVEVAASHYRKIVWYYAKNINNLSSYTSFLNSIKSELMKKLKDSASNKPIKFNLKLEATYNIPHEDNSAEDRSFKTSARSLFVDSDIENIINGEFSSLLSEEDVYTSRGS